MEKKETNRPVNEAIAFAEEMKQLILSLCEDVPDAKSADDAWDKIDRCYHDLEALRNSGPYDGQESFSALTGDVPGHTKYLQGIDLPIRVNSIIDDGQLHPSEVSEMHVGDVDGTTCLLITPEIVG